MALPAGLPPWMYGIDSIQLRKGQAADEGGIDLGTNKIGQQLQALNDGTIVGAGYFCHGGPLFMTTPTGNGCSNPGYGVVTIRMDTPFGPQDLYYQHINIDKSIRLSNSGGVGQKVKKGQIIGTAGVGNPPQNVLEMGVNVPWGGIWGTNHPGPWVDPEAIIRSLMMNYGSNTTSFTASSGIIGTALAGAIATATHLAPDASVAEFLTNIDVALELRNPFQVNITGPAQDFTILGIDTGIPNPGTTVDAAFSGVEQVFGNIINDASALIVRGAFLLIGVIILWAVISQVMMQGINQVLEPVGGVQGAVKIAGALA